MKFYSNINYLFLIWLISLLVISFFGFSTLPHSGKFFNNFWLNLGNWDGGHYLGIAKLGYSQKFQYAFFPLYPLAIRALAQITQNYLLAAILVSSISTFLGLNVLYRLISLDFGKKTAEKAILFFLFFPTSFFLLIAYSEGLFFFLTVSSFYFLKKNKLFWATIAAALASATKLIGLAVVLGLFIEVITTQGINRKNWYIIFAPLGFVVYCIFLYQQNADPFYFLTAENHWQRTLIAPGVGFWETIKNISSLGLANINFNILLDLIFAIFGLGLAIRSLRFLPSSLSVYSLLSIGVPLFTPTLSSIPRFLLPIFPIFILLALIKNRFLIFGYQLISIMLLAVFSILFINGYWIS